MPNEYAYLYTIFSLIPSKKIPLIINKLRLFFKKKFGIIIFLLCVIFFTIDFYIIYTFSIIFFTLICVCCAYILFSYFSLSL